MSLADPSNSPVEDAVRLLDDIGAELLLVAMGLPSPYKFTLSRQVPDQRVWFLHALPVGS